MRQFLSPAKRWSVIVLLLLLRTSRATDVSSANNQPPQVVVEGVEKADPEKDCRAAIAAGDWRFFVMPAEPSPRRVDYPGVPRYAEHLVKEKGAKVIKASRSAEATSLNALGLYAYRYNRFLLQQIPGSDQPEPGYGIPKPDEIVSHNGELTTGNIAQGRHLADYDDGGQCHHSLSAAPGRGPKCDFTRVRAFIWRHWREKTRGYIRVTFNGVDASATAHIFIEPDAQGSWHIAWRDVGISGVCDRLPIVSLVKIPKSQRPGSSYVLSFKAVDGAEVVRL